MELIINGNTAEWKSGLLGKKFQTRVPNANEVQLFKAVAVDKIVYVGVRYNNNSSRLIAYSVKDGGEIDNRTYSWYFDDLMINDGTPMVRFYSYTEKAWMRGRLGGTAGLMAILKEGGQ